MKQHVRALIVDHSEDDAKRLVQELTEAGRAVDWKRVESPEDLFTALRDEPWDIIFTDYSLPRITGREALRIAREQAPESPVIVISGTSGEEVAVAMMRAGAADFFLKGKLSLLPEAVDRELAEAEAHEKLAAIAEAGDDPSTLELADIIDVEAIQSMMEDFHAITGMLSAILDLNGNILVGVGWQDICTKFHRICPRTERHCIESDTLLSRGVAPGEFKAYHCRNHMWDMASPLEIGGRHVGNIYFGQFFYSDEDVDVETFRQQARQYGFDEEEYLAALGRVPRFDRETVDRAMSFYTKLAGMISALSYSNIRLSKVLGDRERAKQSLAEVNLRFREAVRGGNIGLWEWVLATDKVYYSPEWKAQIGYGEDEIGDEFEEWRSRVHPDDLPNALRMLEETLADRRDDYAVEFRVRHKDGSWRWIAARGSALRDEAGEVARMAGSHVDVTERKLAEQELHQYRQGLEELVEARTGELSAAKESAEDALQQLRSTQDQLIQSERHAVLGRLAASVAHEVNSPLGAIASSAGTIMNSYAHFLTELEDLKQWLSSDGGAAPAEILRLSFESKPPALSTRERRSLRASLREKLSGLGVGPSDELAELLVELNLTEAFEPFVQAFQGEEAAARIELLRSLSRIGRGAGIIEIAAQRTSRIIQALQSYANTTPEEEVAEVDVREELETVLTLYHDRWKRDVEIIRDYDEVPPLLCRREEIAQVWTNLILNALQAMNYDGRLRIAVRREEDMLLVSFADTGCGIPEDLRERVFEPFFTTKQPGEGSGIGLDVVRGILERRQGRIDFESTPGEGTTFFVRLPLRPSDVE